MSVPWLTRQLGAGARFKMEAAFGADLSDAAGVSWTWTEVSGVRHLAGTTANLGRSDNVGQAGSAKLAFSVSNPTGDYTPGNPAAAFDVKQNTPIRYLFSLDAFASSTVRYQGFIDSANPLTSGKATTDKRVAITALGKLGQLAGRKKPLKSPMVRVNTAATPAGYWSFEDGKGATSPAASVPGGPALALTSGSMTLGVTDGVPVGSVAAGDILNLKAAEISRPAVAGNGWTVAFAFRFDPTASTNHDVNILAFQCTTLQSSGTPVVFYMHCGKSTPGSPVVGLFDEGGNGYGAALLDMGDDQWHTFVASGANSGSNVTITTIIDGVTRSNTYANIAAGRIRRFGIGPDFCGNVISPFGFVKPDTPYTATLSGIQIMHLGFWDSVVTPDTADALDGYAGESASARLTRLCSEENVALDLVGTSVAAMGPQGQNTLLDLLRECEAADHGTLYDGTGPGLGYQCRSARYNVAAALTLDMGANPPQVADPFLPIFDRQAVKNLYEVKRSGGASAVYERVDGPLGTAAIGIEDASVTLNVATDGELIQHAGWLVGLGTVPGFRYPSVTLKMLGIPSKAAAVIAARKPGWRLTITNPNSKATDLPAGPVDLIVEGWTERTTADTWELTLNCSPFAPFKIFKLDSSHLDGPDRLAL